MERNQKIGLVLPRIPAYSETFFYSKIKGLAQQGLQIYVFTNSYSKGRIEGAKVVNPVINKGFLFISLMLFLKAFVQLFLFKPKRLVRFFLSHRKQNLSRRTILVQLINNLHILCYDLDWIHFGFATMAIGKEYLAQIMDAKMAVSLRGFDIAIYPLKNPGCYEALWKQVNQIHVISDDLRDKMFQQGFTGNKPIVKIPPAIHFERFYCFPKTVYGHPINILSIGRLHWKKGFEYGLSALEALLKKGIDFRYTIIGAGPEKERLIFAAQQLGVSKYVSFLGQLNHAEVIQELKKTNVYFQPSIQEGFCNAVLEAQAAGCICVVSNAEGLSENVLHEKTGFVAQRRNANDLAEKLYLACTLTKREQLAMIKLAQTRVKKEFNINGQIEAFERFYSYG